MTCKLTRYRGDLFKIAMRLCIYRERNGDKRDREMFFLQHRYSSHDLNGALRDPFSAVALTINKYVND